MLYYYFFWSGLEVQSPPQKSGKGLSLMVYMMLVKDSEVERSSVIS